MKRPAILVCSLVIGVIIGYRASFSSMVTEETDSNGKRALASSVSSAPVSLLNRTSAQHHEERAFDSWLEGKHTVKNREELDKLVITMAKQKGKEIFAILEAIPHFDLRTDLQAIALVALVESDQVSLMEFCEGRDGDPLSLKR